MSKIEVNEISKTSTGSVITISSPVSMDSPLKIKSYQTSELSSLSPSAGDLIYDTDTQSLKVYNGTIWEEVGGTVDLSSYATISSLSSYATISSLSSYATLDDVFAYQMIIGE